MTDDNDDLAGTAGSACAYETWPDKGSLVRGRRLTVLTARTHAGAGEEIRVTHVAEATEPSAVLFTMGPKAVLGEFVDGALASDPYTDDGCDPLLPPGLYDGPLVPGPAVDDGYEVTAYRFDASGDHRIVWRLGELVSNELVITVT